MYEEEVTVCKKYPAGHIGPAVKIKLSAITKNVISSPTTLEYTVQPNSCLRLWWSNGGNAIPDTVTIEEVVPAGYTSTSQVATAKLIGNVFTSTPLSAPSPATVITGITGGAGIPGFLAVFTNTPVPPPVLGSISNFVWNDANNNGLQDMGEPGVAGVQLTLGGAGSATTTTDANGHYVFPNLSAGTYTVSVALPSGFSASPTDVPSNDAIDSDASGVSVVIAGNNDTSIDFGVYKVPPPVLGSISNFVWNDANNNGLQDMGEPGVAGVQLTLGGAGSATTTTDANGHYVFPNLSAGTYTVSVALPSGFSASPTDVPSNDALDSDVSGVSVVIAGNHDTSIDFGVYMPLGGSSCGYTQGYWKNHEEKWPAPYSPTAKWMQPGNALASVTWDGLMGMSVAKGNSYMQLAHQWIAATLNKGIGAPMRADVAAVHAQAEAWLISKTPNGATAVPNFKDAQATAWASILDDYNNGRLGTPHCN